MPQRTCLAAQLSELIQADGCPVGAQLPAQMLADRLRVSRSPINEALQHLHEKGILARQRNRGYFVARDVPPGTGDLAAALGLQSQDAVTEVYFRIADDLLRGALATAVKIGRASCRERVCQYV